MSNAYFNPKMANNSVLSNVHDYVILSRVSTQRYKVCQQAMPAIMLCGAVELMKSLLFESANLHVLRNYPHCRWLQGTVYISITNQSDFRIPWPFLVEYGPFIEHDIG